MIALMFFCVVMTFIVGFGYMLHTSGTQNHEMKVECIRAGKSVVNGSCVSVLP